MEHHFYFAACLHTYLQRVELEPGLIRVFNKIGWSYGFLADVSYVVDFEIQVEYMLAATVCVNSDGLLNDGKYDYDTVGYSFLYNLGKLSRFELPVSNLWRP